tara:strand:+ start:772 stop:1452 length:681 start_codon:yes stop_codon:yes gene_type:complete
MFARKTDPSVTHDAKSNKRQRDDAVEDSTNILEDERAELKRHHDETTKRISDRLMKVTLSESKRITKCFTDNHATVLHKAVSDGEETAARNILARHSIQLNIADSKGVTPLMIAIHNGNLKVMTLLIEAGARFNGRTLNGDTPLSLAASNYRLNPSDETSTIYQMTLEKYRNKNITAVQAENSQPRQLIRQNAMSVKINNFFNPPYHPSKNDPMDLGEWYQYANKQ